MKTSAVAKPEPLTPIQLECLEIIQGTFTERGCAPTVREIADEMELRSSNSVHRILEILERKGWIRRFTNRSRGIVMLHPAPGYDLPEPEFHLSDETLPAHLAAELARPQ